MPKGGMGLSPFFKRILEKKNLNEKSNNIFLYIMIIFHPVKKQKRRGGKEGLGKLFITIREQSYTAFFL